MIGHINERMNAKSAALLLTIDRRLDVILKYWLLVASFAAELRIITSLRSMPVASLSTVSSYVLVVLAPFASTLVALRWFSNGHLYSQPMTRLARVGRWRSLTFAEARVHPLYGTSGIMVSLLVGMMLNVPSARRNIWRPCRRCPRRRRIGCRCCTSSMTFDVVVFTSLYMIAFVAALRRVPLFPRLLLAIWLGDLPCSWSTAQMVACDRPVPQTSLTALQAVLTGNVKEGR